MATMASLGHQVANDDSLGIKQKMAAKFAHLAKFRPAVIGSQQEGGERHFGFSLTPQTASTVRPLISSKEKLLGRFHKFTKQRQEEEEGEKDKDEKKEVELELQNLVTTESVKITSQDPSPITSSLASSESPAPESENGPKALGLKVDSQQKRSAIHDTPEGDGLFLVVVLCVALVSIIAVLGVGYCLHHPTCPPLGPTSSASPFSDTSPSFQSAQLAFSSSPEQDKPDQSGQTAGQTRPSGPAPTHWPDNHSSSASRAHKFRSQMGAQERTNYNGIQRMESLIDIGPDDDEEDDMIYECPGLAPHGEMEVTNPFFLSKGLCEMSDGENEKPCPVNNNNSMRHGNIQRNIQPGQQ